VNAAAAKAREAIDRLAGMTWDGGGVTMDSAGADSLGKKSTGITESED